MFQGTILLPWIIIVISKSSLTDGTSYENVTSIFTDKLDAGSGYNTAVRPLKDQSQPINVSVAFDIIALIEIDDIRQQFIINGYLTVSWVDELLAWNPTDYNNAYAISPYPKQIWRPRLILGNTLEDRDLFEDDYCPTTALFNGSIAWYPGSLFPTSCKLNLFKYPFDKQLCTIDLYSMALTADTVVFVVGREQVGQTFYALNGEWELTQANIFSGASNGLAYFQIRFSLRRRPGFFVINIVLPVVLLSFLNIMVFVIPVESGEKISYSITVLLALAVFMSIVSEMLPRSSDVLPLVTIYLMVLLIISVCTVIVAILIVSFHHRGEKETKRLKATSTFKGMLNKVKLLNTAATHFKPQAHTSETEVVPMENEEEKAPAKGGHSMIDALKNLRNLKKTVPAQPETEKEKHDKYPVNKWRIIGRYIDFMSFVIFTTIWVSVTIGFLIAISSD